MPVAVDLVHAVLVKEWRRRVERRNSLVFVVACCCRGGVSGGCSVGAVRFFGFGMAAMGVAWQLGCSFHHGCGAFPVRKPRFLDHPVRHIHAEAVHAAVQPEPQHRAHFLLDLGVVPVQVRLLGVKEVQVPFAGRAVCLCDAGPGRAAEDGLPVVRGQVTAPRTGDGVLAWPEHVTVPFA
ncbi:hypothetical protein D9M72_374730 [compost metagenome]